MLHVITFMLLWWLNVTCYYIYAIMVAECCMLLHFSVDPTILYRLINILQNASFSDNLIQQSIETLKREWLK